MVKMSKKTSRRMTRSSSKNSLRRLKSGRRMSTVSEKIKKGLEEILEYKKGKKTLRTKLIDLPEPPTGIC